MSVGRVVHTHRALPAVLPVNSSQDSDGVLIAFEVDEVGAATVVRDPGAFRIEPVMVTAANRDPKGSRRPPRSETVEVCPFGVSVVICAREGV